MNILTPIEMLSNLVSFPSITPNECGIYDFIQDQFNDFKIIQTHKEGVKNLFLYKDFGEDSSKRIHLCFGGHIDVVPPGKGWDSDPFKPVIKDGFMYARGTQDMKSGVSAFVCALRDFAENYSDSIALRLSILLTSDEEGAGTYGTKIMLDELKNRDLLPDIAVVAEPTCSEKMGDCIKIGRRGSINGKITIQGKQGHVAYPEKCINPIELLGAKLGKLAGVDLDVGDENFSPTRLVITDIRGGIEVVNVTPNDLKIMFNVRNSTHTDINKLKKYIEDVLNGLRYELELNQTSFPFITDSNTFIAKKLSESIQKICNITPKYSTSGGTSDARYFSQYGIEVVEFGVLNDTIHSVNERVRISDVELLYQVFLDMIKNIANKKEA